MSELKTILGDTVNRMFADLATKEVKQAAERGEWPEALWRALAEAGLPAVLVPESAGGAGAAWDTAYVVIRAAGEYAVPVPLAETILASWLLALAGHDIPPQAVLTIGGEGLALNATPDGWRVSGIASRVPYGIRADYMAAVIPVDGDTHVALIETGEAEAAPGQNLAREPRDTLAFDGAPVAASAPVNLPGDAAKRLGALLRSIQMAGALDFVMNAAAQYATERVQFGQPIARFQAIQQQLAVLAGEAAAASLAAEYACQKLAAGRDAGFEIAVAKVRAGDAAGPGAGIAHQTHGAIGFTYEHGLHYATRRLWSWRAEYGASAYWAQRIGRDVAARGGAELWPFLTAR